MRLTTNPKSLPPSHYPAHIRKGMKLRLMACAEPLLDNFIRILLDTRLANELFEIVVCVYLIFCDISCLLVSKFNQDTPNKPRALRFFRAI